MLAMHGASMQSAHWFQCITVAAHSGLKPLSVRTELEVHSSVGSVIYTGHCWLITSPSPSQN